MVIARGLDIQNIGRILVTIVVKRQVRTVVPMLHVHSVGVRPTNVKKLVAGRITVVQVVYIQAVHVVIQVQHVLKIVPLEMSALAEVVAVGLVELQLAKKTIIVTV